MAKPNIGESATSKNGMTGTVWGTMETDGKSFVQFAPNGEWLEADASVDPVAQVDVRVDTQPAADPPAPAPAATKPAAKA